MAVTVDMMVKIGGSNVLMTHGVAGRAEHHCPVASHGRGGGVNGGLPSLVGHYEAGEAVHAPDGELDFAEQLTQSVNVALYI